MWLSRIQKETKGKYSYKATSHENSQYFFLVWNQVINGFFLIDMALNFFLCYEDPETVKWVYDNTKIAVARILGDGRRQRTRVFSELQSHYLFTDRFGRPGKGNDKGKVEGLVGVNGTFKLTHLSADRHFESDPPCLAVCCPHV